MAEPTQYDLAEAPAEALASTVHTGSGVKHIPDAVDRNSNPTLLAQLKNLERKMFDQLMGCNRGQVVWSGSGLTVGAYALEYELGGMAYSFAGDAAFSVSLPVSFTSYVYLDTAGTLKSQITSWPSGDHVKLAMVTTDATQVTGIVDMRLANLQVGVVNNWWNIPPTALVNFNGQDVDEIANLGFQDSVTLTLDSDGGIALSGQPTMIRLNTYASAPTDDLESIDVTGISDNHVFILHGDTSDGVVTVKDSAINSPNGDFVISGIGSYLVLIVEGGNIWELSRNIGIPSTFTQNMSANGFSLQQVGAFSLKAESVTIAAGSITVTRSYAEIDTEAAAAFDDLDSISGGTWNGQLLVLKPSGTNKPIVKHNVGNILLHTDDYTMWTVDFVLVLLWTGTAWIEVTRSHPRTADLANVIGPDSAIPYTVEIFESGALTTGVKKYKRHVTESFTIKDVHAYVGTAPSGGACIVDILVNGSSIFANQAEMVNIADAATFDSSAVKNRVAAASDTIEFEIEAANSAADLTLVINGYIEPKTPPT